MQADDPLARWIAAYAALIATGNLAWSIYIGKRDAAAVYLNVELAAITSNDNTYAYHAFHVTNRGRRKIVINEFGLCTIRGHNLVHKIQRLPLDRRTLPTERPSYDALPAELEETQRTTLFALATQLTEQEQQQFGELPLAYVKDTLDRLHTCKLEAAVSQQLWPGASYAAFWKRWAFWNR
jgi:hypothetical protein